MTRADENSEIDGFDFRRAAAPDLQLLRLILSETWRSTYEPLLGRSAVDEMERSMLAEEPLRATLDNGVTWLAASRLDGEAAALVYAWRDDDGVFVQRLYVRPAFQGRGLGRALLRRVAAFFPGRTITLDVEADNASAAGFYRALGFVETGQGAETIAGVRFRVRRFQGRL